MKTTKIAILILGIALALYILIPGLSWAEDGTTPPGAKCSCREARQTRGLAFAFLQAICMDSTQGNGRDFATSDDRIPTGMKPGWPGTLILVPL